jgi:hypothetical protein
VATKKAKSMSYQIKPLRAGVTDAAGNLLAYGAIEVPEPTNHWLRAEQTGDVTITESEAPKASKKAKE